MTTISIIYYSGAGHTAQLAEAIGHGASCVEGVQTHLLPITGADIVEGRYSNEAVLKQLDASDAILFGSPTYMGGPAAQFKAFADATAERWFQRTWRDKLAAGFTVSGSASGDKLGTLQALATLALQHGMIWVGVPETPANDKGVNRLGSFLGAMALGGHEPGDGTPSPEDKLTGEILGRRVAALTKQFKGN